MMAASLNSVVGLVARSYASASVLKGTNVSTTSLMLKPLKGRRSTHIYAVESDHITTDSRNKDAENAQRPFSPPLDTAAPLKQLENSTRNDTKLPDSEALAQKRTPLTAREKLRAARVLSRYSESKATESERGSKVLDALRESEKGKKGLPAAPTNMFDDSKRGLPKQGLTFNFPGGFDLFIIAFSFVFISTVMFATTYIVWKAGAIHFNEY
ncbi:hypothetical protein Ancab_021572 [Ancistrocladus abbreviatus]